MRANQSVGVGGVSNNTDLDSLLGDGINCGTLSLENFGIGLEKVRTFHSWASWSSTDKNGDIGILEANHGVSGGDDISNAGVGTILKFHGETLENFLGLRKFNELKDYLLVRSKHSSLSDEVAKERTNLSSSSSDCNTNRGLLKVQWDGREVSSERLESAY